MDSNDIRVPVRYLQAADDGDEFDENDGPWRFSGIAVAPGDVLHMEDGTPVLFTAEELEPAADTQAGEPLTADHPTDDFGRPEYPPETDDTYGKVVKSDYIEDRGVAYEATTHDPELARGIHGGTYEVSVHPRFRADETDDETGLLKAEDIEFLDLSVVSKGDSPSNEVNWGPSAELEAWAQATDIGGELTATLSRPRTPEYDSTEFESEQDWSGVEKTFSAFVDGYYRHNDAERPDETVDTVGEAPQPVRNWIAARTLLGDPDASTVEDLIVLPVVNPATNALNESGLVAAVRMAPQVSGISENTATSAQDKARRLLNNEFDRDVKTDAMGGATSLLSKAAQMLGFDVDIDGTGHLVAQHGDEPAESGTDSSEATAAFDHMDDDTIQTLVEEHDYSRESLEAMQDDDVERLADTLIDEDDDGEQADNQTQASAQIPEEFDSLEEYVTAKAEAVAEEKQSQSEKEELADEIIAHSQQFGEDDRDDLLAMDQEVLKKTHSEFVTAAAQLPGATGRPAELSAGAGPAESNEAGEEYKEIAAQLNGSDTGGDD